MTEEAPPQEVIAAPAPAIHRPSRKPLVIAASALVVAVVAVVVGLSLVGGSGSKDLTVTFSLLDLAGSSTCDGGTGGYSDIGPATAVVVRDNGGQIIGTAQLGDGASRGFPDAAGGGGCVWQTTVKGVPTGKKSYSVEVGHRGAQEYSSDQLGKSNWILGVSLGGN